MFDEEGEHKINFEDIQVIVVTSSYYHHLYNKANEIWNKNKEAVLTS